MKLLILLLAVGYCSAAQFATGIVSQQCMGCICQQESGCKALGCRQDVGSLSCGYFQIKQAYWTDCGKPGGSLAACASDLACASGCVQRYMARYVRHFCGSVTCEHIAREHNGGPAGCKHSSTLGYWAAVRSHGC